MAQTIEVPSAYGTYYRIDSSSSKDVLTSKQMESNVTVIFNIISDVYPTWTHEAIAAICGNGQSEGALNPNQWQYGLNKSTSGGYGLWQWTPATKFLNWCAENGFPNNDIYHQIARLEYERENGLQYYKTSAYNFSFTDFLEGSHTVSELAKAWLYNYERPADPASTEAIRVSRSERWYTFISGEAPQPPDPNPPDPPEPVPGTGKRYNLPFYMYPSWRSRL